MKEVILSGLMDYIMIGIMVSFVFMVIYDFVDKYFLTQKTHIDSGKMLVSLYAYKESKRAGKHYPLSMFTGWNKYNIKD